MGPDRWGDVANLAHELRSPLAAMRVAAELLDEAIDQPDAWDLEQSRKMVRSLHRGTLWLQQLVENLLGLEAARTGGLGRHPEPLDLHDSLRGTMLVLEPLLAAKGQRLEIETAESLPRVVGERQPLGQVYANLLTNASKFSPPGSSIRVRLMPAGERVRVAVEDRGPGIPDGCAARLFEAYYQAPTPTAPAHRGVGLGLAIVKEIVLASGGQVGAENRDGGGARVWFELPAVHDSGKADVPGVDCSYSEAV